MARTHIAPTRDQAIVALHDLFDRAFGHDKGSDESYISWCEDRGLCLYGDDEDFPDMPSDWPGELEFLAAVGITKEEMIRLLHINPEVFRDKDPTDAA